jgi:hypothetical protein
VILNEAVGTGRLANSLVQWLGKPIIQVLPYFGHLIKSRVVVTSAEGCRFGSLAAQHEIDRLLPDELFDNRESQQTAQHVIHQPNFGNLLTDHIQ